MHGTRFQIALLAALALVAGAPRALAQASETDRLALAGAAGRFVAHGRYVGTGVPGHTITGLGFRPDFVIVKSEDAALAYGRTSTMSGDTSKSIASSTSTRADRIVALDADGFTLGSGPEVNSLGVAYQWVAFHAAPGIMTTGSYAGDGIDRRRITGLGLDPNLMVIVPESGRSATIRFPNQLGDASFSFASGSNNVNDRIQAFFGDGFELGNSAFVNQLGATFHYVAWHLDAATVAAGVFAGDSSDGRTIATGVFRPSYVLLRGDANAGVVQRSASLLGDLTLPLEAGAAFADGIQALLPYGFEVGSLDRVNRNGDNFYWVAFSNGTEPLADLAVDLAVERASPNPGATVGCLVLATNVGTVPFAAAQLGVAFSPGLTYAGHAASAGTYDPITSTWAVSALLPGDTDSLIVHVQADAGASGAVLRAHAVLRASIPADELAFNNADSLDIVVGAAADLAVTLQSTPAAPSEGDSLTYHVQVRNLGPLDAAGIVLADSLSAGLAAVGATSSHGAYEVDTGLWHVGNLAAGTSAELTLRAVVTSGGSTALSHRAAVVNAQPPDPNPANNAAERHIATLVAEAFVTSNAPVHPGDWNVALLGFRLTNYAASAAPLTTLQVTCTGAIDTLRVWLDNGDLVLDPSLDTQIASGEPGNGTWIAAFPDVAVAWQRSLLVSGDVSLTGAPHGSRLDARILQPAGLGWSAPVSVVSVRGFPLDSPGQPAVHDLVRAQIAFTPLPAGTTFPGSTGVPLLQLHVPDNGGSSDVLERFDLQQVGSALAGADIAAMWLQRLDGPVAPKGDGTAPGPRRLWLDVEAGELVHTGGGRWSASALSMPVLPGGAELRVVADVAAEARNRLTLQAELPIDAMQFESGRRGPTDAVWRNPDATAIHAESILEVTPGSWVSRAELVARTARDIPVLALQLVARAADPDTLSRVRLWNDSSGLPGETPHVHAQIARVDLWHDTDGSGDAGPADVRLQSLAPDAAGELAFGLGTPLGLPLQPHVPLHVLVTLTPDSLLVRDAERLAVRLAQATDVETRGGLAVSLPTALRTPVPPRVDGQAAVGYAVVPQASRAVFAASKDVVVLDFAVPSNGIDADVMESLRIENAGTATNGDIERMWLRRSDGVAGVDAGDTVVAELVATGLRAWQAADIGLAIPAAAATRFLITVDIQATPARGATFRARVPIGGVGMTSGNDGPNDTPLDGGETIVFMQPDNVTWIAGVAGQSVVPPNATRQAVLVLEAFNAYDSPRILEGLVVRLTGTADEREFLGWGLYPDTNQNGVLDDEEPSLAMANPRNGRLAFEGFAHALPARQQRRLLVAYTLLPDWARDASRIDAEVTDERSFRYRDVATSGTGAFPLDSAGFDRVDGHVLVQIQNDAVTPRTLGGGETHVLALGVMLPANGWQADTLQSLDVEIAPLPQAAVFGTDVAALRLWRESSAGNVAAFDPASDALLATGVNVGGRMRFPGLASVIPPGGARFYVTIDAAVAPVDGHLLQLVLPVNAAQMRSGNDGPLDGSLAGTATHRFSASELLASVSASPAVLSTGQTVDVVIDVLNRGSATLTSIVPFDVTADPYASATWIAGPTPAQFDLQPQESAAFTLRFQLNAPGTAAFTAVVGTSDSAVTSAPARSANVRVEDPAAPLDVALLSNLPVSVNRGQANLTPLFWQFDYPSASGAVAAVRIHRVRFAVEDASGAPQSAASVFASLEIRTGGLVHASWSSIPDSAIVDVSLNPPVVLQPGEARDLPLTVNVAADAAASTFRVRLDAGAVQATDATSGLPVSVNATLPWSTTAASVRTPAPYVDVVAAQTLPATANRGQTDVAAGRWTLAVPGAPGESEARITSFAFTIQDSSGAGLAADAVLSRARVRSGGATLADASGLDLAGTAVTLAFDIPSVVVSGAPEELELWLDVAPAAAVPSFQIAVLDSGAIEARDANSGSAVPLRLQPPAAWPWRDGPVRLQNAALLADLAATSRAPETSLPGATRVQVAHVVLVNRDAPGSADMRVTGLTFAARDDADRPPNQILHGARLTETGVLRGEASALPASGNQVLLPLDLSLAAGDSLALDLEVDLAATLASPWLRFGLSIDAFDVVDANDPTNTISPAGKTAFETGFVHIVAPSRVIALGVAEEPTTNVLRGAIAAEVLTVRLAHPGAINEEPIQPHELTLDLRDVAGAALPVTAIAAAARLRTGAVSFEAAVAGTGLVFNLSGVAALAPATELDLQLEFDFVTTPAVTDFRIGLDAGALRASGNIGQVDVAAFAGQALPYESPTIHFVAPDLHASLSAYPNPFRPNEHGACKVSVYLAADADVTCDVYTLSGERVVRAMGQQPMKAGLHELPGWDGRNAEGRLVRSGMYLLRLKVDGPNGGEVFRKVAVVR